MAKKISIEDNFGYLLFALIFLLFSTATVQQFASGAGLRLIGAATVMTLIIGVWSIHQQKYWFRVGLGFTTMLIIVAMLGIFFEQKWLDVIHLLLILGFLCMTTLVAARQVLFTGEITINKIIGSICIFLLLGLIWATLYLLLLEQDPATFNNISRARWYNNFSEITYFSFVTLTMLGYGDITPALPVARFLAYIEAFVGLFYIAIMVSSLVGVRIAYNRANKNRIDK